MEEQPERTFITVKPGGVHRGLVGAIIGRFEKKGFKLVGLKLVWPTKELSEQHYKNLSSQPFFPETMSSGPVVAMVWEGLEAVKSARLILGAPNPAESVPGTILADFCIEAGNILHGSDCVESAKKEVALWFTDDEVVGWIPANEHWLNKRNE